MRFPLKILTLMCLMMIPSITANASSIEVSAGTYLTDGDSHYKNQEFTLTSWGDGFTMGAVLVKEGHEYPVEAFLRPTGNNEYSGSGLIVVNYDNGKVCKHRFGTRFFVTDDGLFLRENTPAYIPFNPRGACTGAGPYTWFNHPEVYTLQK